MTIIITFSNPNQFPANVAGTTVVVSYQKPQDKAFTEALKSGYVKDSVTLTRGGRTCGHNELVFNGNELNLAQADNQNCPFLINPTIDQRMTLSYRTRNQTFTIDGLETFRAIYSIEVWEVKIDGQPTTDYTIDENNYTLSFADNIGENKKIEVTISFMN